MNISRLLLSFCAVVLMGLAPAGAALFAAPQAELWPRWEAHDPSSRTVVDHSAWAAFLDTYLVTDTRAGVNLVPYGDVRDRDRLELQRYIALLTRTQVSQLNRDEQMAYWLNLYNALTVELILQHYSVESIRDIKISGPLVNRHPWDAKLVSVEGEELSLNDIEHRIMRPIWQDPRIHYGVNCASIGCPNLLPVPFTGDNYREQFDRAASAYINHQRGARFEGSRLHLSSIFTWYQEDFGGDIGGVVAHLLEYAAPELAVQLRVYQASGYRPRPRYDYDWSLNQP